jgi:hypothetical protein
MHLKTFPFPIFSAIYAFPLSFHFHMTPFSDQIKAIINLFPGKSEGRSLSIKEVDVFPGLEEISVQ